MGGKPNVGEQRCRTLACRTCTAQPGQPCHTALGRRLPYVHAARYWDARDAGLVPITEQEVGPR